MKNFIWIKFKSLNSILAANKVLTAEIPRSGGQIRQETRRYDDDWRNLAHAAM